MRRRLSTGPSSSAWPRPGSGAIGRSSRRCPRRSALTTCTRSPAGRSASNANTSKPCDRRLSSWPLRRPERRAHTRWCDAQPDTWWGGAGAGVVVICAAHFLIGADGLAVAIALPAMQRVLGVATIDGQWVLSAYGLAFGGTLLVGGRLGGLYGRRRALVSGLAVFATGALVAG